jgi:dipeptidase
MCNTLVVMGNFTKDGSVLLAKNINREPLEKII